MSCIDLAGGSKLASHACGRAHWPPELITLRQLDNPLCTVTRRRANQIIGKGSVESFHNISSEVLSLHAVLKESRENLLEPQLPPERENRLRVVLGGCTMVLEDLQTLVTKYERLGSKSKSKVDRMKWPNENIAEIRSRLTSNAVLLTAFIR